MTLSHFERRKWISEITQINKQINEQMEERIKSIQSNEKESEEI